MTGDTLLLSEFVSDYLINNIIIMYIPSVRYQYIKSIYYTEWQY